MPNIGPLELIIVLVIILVVFGPKRLPSLGRQLGAGMREFKDSVTGKSKDDEDDDDVRPTITQSTATAEPVAEPRRSEEPQPRA